MERLRLGYCRVSTASDEQQQALPYQQSRVNREGCDLILSDVESGLNPLRPGYLELRRLVAAGRVAEVIATEFSRLGRDAMEADALVRLCDQHGTIVRTLAEGAQTMATPEGLLLTRLRSSLSQGESMRLSARVRRGIDEGRRHGRPMRKPAWGYRLTADRKALEPDPEAWPVANRFITALRSGHWRLQPTLQAFAEPIPLRSCRSVRAWLLNPTLRGGIGYQQGANHTYAQVLWGLHPALLSDADFQAYETAAAANRRQWGANADRRLRALTGLCRCTECGWRLKYISGRTIPSLRCGGIDCSQHYRGVREAAVIAWALEQITHEAGAALARLASTAEPPEVISLRQQIASLERLADPDLEPALAAKRQRLELLTRLPGLDQGLLRSIQDPRWAAAASYAEVRDLLQQTVVEIQIARQAPAAIRLKL